MFNTNFTSLREVQRNPKRVAKQVSESNKPTVVISNNKPQFAIVSLKMLDDLEKIKAKNSVTKLIELAAWAEKQDFKLPKDLSKNHDTYTRDK